MSAARPRAGDGPAPAGPYVGPGPFGSQQKLFGRDAEIEELQWRLVADRIIVLYSPSGAGKTSLLTASNGLVSQLGERFHALPVLRVGGKDGTDPVRAMLAQLEARGFGALSAGDTLLAYFNRIAIPQAHPPKRLLLVLDQFEEIFTGGATVAEQREFFRQLGELASREASPVWLLVSMREEYFSWLDSFRDLVPTRLANTFRLSLLSPEQAVAAVKGPALEAGVSFPAEGGDDAATRLVRELSKVRVRSPSGAVQTRAGTSVEAVQLQVICSDLWTRLSAGGRPVAQIKVSDLNEYKPETALQDYCDQALEQAAPKPPRAGALRDWVDRRLLTPSGLRSPTMVDPQEKNCPTPQELSVLQECHLIRRQSREDGEWYELSHDSLAGPVRGSIEAWRSKNLEAWQQLARAWHLGGERTSYFKSLPRSGLRSIPAPLEDSPYSEIECRFLADYADHRRQRRMWTGFYATAAALLAVLGYQYSEQLQAEAELLAARNATAVQAGVLSILGGKPSLDLGARAAVAGFELQQNNADIVALDFRTLLGDYLNKTRQIEKVESLGNGRSRMVLLDKDRRVVADIGYGRHGIEVSETGGAGEGQTWTLGTEALQKAHANGVRVVALLEDGQLAVGDSDGTIRTWSLNTRQPVGVPLAATDGANAPLMHSPVRTLAYAQGVLYAGYEQGAVAAWNVASPASGTAQLLWSARLPSRVSALAIYGGGDSVAAADISADEQVTLLKNAAGTVQRTRLAAVPKEGDYRGAFYSIAVSPDERFVAAGNRAGKIHVWDMATRAHVLRIDGHDQAVAQLKYLHDGSLLSLGWDGRLKIWTFAPGGKAAPVGRTLMELSRQLISAAVSTDEQTAFVTTEKGDLVRVSLAAGKHPFGHLLAKAGPFARLAESGNELRLIAAGRDALVTARVDRQSGAPQDIARSGLRGIVGVARAEAAKAVFVAQADRIVVVRDGEVDGRPLDGLMLPITERIMSIHASDSGSLLVARTITTELPRMWRTRVWALSPQTLGVLDCEVPLPATFPRSTRLVQFRPGGNEFVTAQVDAVLAWQPKENASGCPEIQEAPYKVPEVRGEIQALAFDPAGKSLWIANFAGQLHSVELGGAAPKISAIKDDANTVGSAVAVSSNGTVALGDTNGRLYVFQPGARLPLQIGQDFHDSQITSLALSKDGRWLVSSSDAGTAVWDLNMETWIRKACVLAADRSFSNAENETYFKRVTEKPTPCAKSR